MSFNEAVAANYITLFRRINPDKERIIRFSEILWPIMFIQSEPNYKLMIDNVGLSKFEMKLSNAPRTAQVGHVLRDQEMHTIEKLDLVVQIMKFKKKVQVADEDLSPQTDEEFIVRSIYGLFQPPILESIGNIIHYKQEFDPNEFSLLESQFTFDDAINYAQQWIETLREIKGNKERWQNLLPLVDDPINKWLLELNVKIKDIKEIYNSDIQNVESIDEDTIKDRINHAQDNVEQWVLQEQKNIIEKIGKMFVGIDLIFENLRKRNRYFLNIEPLRTKKVEEVVTQAFQNVAAIRDSLVNCDEELDNISTKMNDIRRELEKTQKSADDQIDSIGVKLLDKKQAQDFEKDRLKKEMNQKITEIQEKIDLITQKYSLITDLIEAKIKQCKFEEIQMKKWQIDDNITNISNPTSKFFIPIGIAIIEDEEEEERIEITFPAIFSEPNLIRKEFSPAFTEFEKDISEILELDIRLRSNFEFTCEKSKNYSQTIRLGLDSLEQRSLVSKELKGEIMAQLDKIGS